MSRRHQLSTRMSLTHDPNADRDRIAATRVARERAQNIASLASAYLRETATACAVDGERFAQLQQRPQNLSQVIVHLATVRAAVEELEALLPEIDAVWNGRELEALEAGLVELPGEEAAR